jgi:short-subunit dehydrogenase
MNRPNEFFHEQNVLVTGASSGIGAAIAEQLGLYGANVALLARRREELEQVARRVEQAGGRALVLVGDTTELEDVRRAHQQMCEQLGAVGTAVLNAGIGRTFPLRRFTAQRVRQIFEVNLMGVVNWLEVLLPPMLEAQTGTIVGMSSLAAHISSPFSGAYSASKAALSNLFGSLRIEGLVHVIYFCFFVSSARRRRPKTNSTCRF